MKAFCFAVALAALAATAAAQTDADILVSPPQELPGPGACRAACRALQIRGQLALKLSVHAAELCAPAGIP